MVATTLSGLFIKRLDHLGLVSGMCRELKIAGMIDATIPKGNEHKVSHGQALVAIILNGLGFHSRTLHIFPDFFTDKPTERLISPSILPDHLNDDVLGRSLDALFEAGVSGYWVDVDYVEVPQKWLVLRNEQATKRERRTLEQNLLKNSEKEQKQFIKLCNTKSINFLLIYAD